MKIHEDIVDRAIEFSEASVSSNANKYARRNQNDIEKIKQDIKIGRIGEEIVYLSLKDKFSDISKPDYTIYDAKDKSWDPDLKTNNIKIAVKSQDIRSDLQFGTSWVFQFNNNKSYDCDKEIFKETNDNQYVAMVSLNVPKRQAEIKAIVKVSWLHEKKLFKDMKQEYLKGNKLAVYYEDLLNFKEDLFQL